MTTTRELAWAAGLFEGEGCFSERKDNKESSYVSAALGMTDEDSVRRFARAVGVGKVYGPYRSANQHKPAWYWRTAGHEKVQHVAALLWFGLGKRRREQAKRTLGENRRHNLTRPRAQEVIRGRIAAWRILGKPLSKASPEERRFYRLQWDREYALARKTQHVGL